MAGEGPLAPGPVPVDGVEDQKFFLGQQGLTDRRKVKGVRRKAEGPWPARQARKARKAARPGGPLEVGDLRQQLSKQ